MTTYRNYQGVPFQKFWIMFDLSNGDKNNGGYAWFFKTKKEAVNHRRNQHKIKEKVRLSNPILVKNPSGFI